MILASIGKPKLEAERGKFRGSQSLNFFNIAFQLFLRFCYLFFDTGKSYHKISQRISTIQFHAGLGNYNV